VRAVRVKAINLAARRLLAEEDLQIPRRIRRRIRKSWARRGHPATVIGQARIGRSFEGRAAQPSFRDRHVAAAVRAQIASEQKGAA
jgi:hypothetical protein